MARKKPKSDAPATTSTDNAREREQGGGGAVELTRGATAPDPDQPSAIVHTR
jgi:hypothetical protein